jgi:homoserine dehydrogenase
VVRALVRDLDKERDYPPEPGVLTADIRDIVEDDDIAIVAEVMGGVEPTGEYVLELLRRGKHIVSANKQLVARRGGELFAAALEAKAQLRFEASVCAAIPVIKVLREALVVTNVHRVLGIVNGTTNFVLTEMESGKSYDEALAEAQERGFAEADPTDDVSGADAAAKMAILATSPSTRASTSTTSSTRASTRIDPADVAAARELDMVIRLVGAARSWTDRSTSACTGARRPAASARAVERRVQRGHAPGRRDPRDHARGPGAGGIETASAVIADITTVIGTMHTGFLQNDAAWRSLPRLPAGDNRSPFYFRLSVEDRPGALAHVAEELAHREISIARLLQHQNGDGAALHVVTHEARAGALEDALAALGELSDVHRRSNPLPVVSDRGVSELGWA